MNSKFHTDPEGTSIRNGITAEFFDRYPHKGLFNELELEPSCNDDVLIASILRYTTSNEAKDVMLVTTDTGLRLKAKRFTIPTLQLPDTYALTPDPDPLELENRKLKERINVLQSAVPKLALSFTGSGKVETKQSFTIGNTIHSEEDIAKWVAEQRSKFPKESLPPHTVQKSKSPGDIMEMKLAEFHTKTNPHAIPREEYLRYNKEIDDYLTAFKAQFETRNDIAQRCIPISITLQNTGTAPAHDVDISMHFPDGFRLYTEEEIEDLAPLPTEPRAPRSSIQKITDGFNFSLPVSPIVSVPSLFDQNSLTIKKTNSYEVAYHVLNLKHGQYEAFPRILLVFDSHESAQSFSCTYSILAANYPEPITGHLHFIIHKKK